MTPDDPLNRFLVAATWHGSLDEARALLAAHPEIAASGIHAAAVLGDDEAVRDHVARDPASAAGRAGPYSAAPLVYLCLSKYLRLDAARSEAFLRAATTLLDAGADANAGFWTEGPYPEFETALYGAAGVAHHAPMTRLLLERGANPNDEEAVYHSPETRDNDAMRLLVETGRLTDDNLLLMLIRKHDWHDYDGVKYLLAKIPDVNQGWKRGIHALNHAIARDNAIEIIDLLFEHGADPMSKSRDVSAAALAARKGRGDVLGSIDRRGLRYELSAADRLIAGCARHDEAAVRAVAEREPALLDEVVAHGGQLIAEFAGVGNTDGVRLLLDLGVPVSAPFVQGDGYFDEAKNSTALHVAAWRARHRTVKLLIERGAPLDLRDGKGRTPLMLAVKACVDSYWSDWRSPESVAALLAAGASVDGVAMPSGYAEVDRLLANHRSGA
jgi:ankyrin repeat protein